VSKRLTNIQRAADAMSGVVERCIQLERLDQGEQPIELVECQLRDIVAGLRVLDEPSRERLRMTIPDDAMLIADGHLLGVMLDNLIDNALKYAVPGSGIQIAYATEWRDGQPVGLISVENSVAPGMAPAADKMFVRYFRGAQSHEYTGTGLGLYLVRTMARLQGGDAEYRTPAEDKVVVSICLPAAAGRASA
jgi:signal transduction histidine kinase